MILSYSLGAMDNIISDHQVALHKHEDGGRVPKLSVGVLNFGCHGWLLEKHEYINSLPYKP